MQDCKRKFQYESFGKTKINNCEKMDKPIMDIPLKYGKDLR